MNEVIDGFIKSAENWDDNFKIEEYDYAKYDCEVATICKAQKENDINTLINFWNEKLEHGYFELRHPIHNHIITRAVFSTVEHAAFVAMIDKENQYPWIFIQHYCMMNNIIIPNAALKLYNTWQESQFNSLMNGARNFLSNMKIDNFYFKNIPYAFATQFHRPAHFFSEDIQGLLFMDQNKLKQKKILSPAFFISKQLKKIQKTDKFIFIRPTTCYGTNVYSNILQESLEDYHILTDKDQLKQDYDLTIWLGLPGERRAWFEQIDGAANILKHLNKYFNKIKVYIDGMTAYDGERKDFPENKLLFDKVVNTTRKLFLEEYNKNIIFSFEDLQDLASSSIANEERFVVFKSLAGYDYRTKICYCNDCDIVIGDAGTTALVPFEFHKKPGVIIFGHALEKQVERYRLLHQVKLISKDYLITKDINGWSMNYHIPPQHIYNLAAEVLEELSGENKLKIKNLKMHRLDVPPVELIAKQYELEQTLKIKLPIESVALYSELEKQINTLVLHNNTTLNQALENINTNNALSSTLQHSLQTKDQTIQNLENKIKDIEFKFYFKTAKARIQNHLAYKLGNALIENSKSIFGYIRMPYILSYIRDMHRLEQKRYEENIKRYPELTLPPLESYPDYKEALKEKECFTYRLGLALMRADKEWYKGGYIKFYFESRKMKKELLQRKVNE